MDEQKGKDTVEPGRTHVFPDGKGHRVPSSPAKKMQQHVYNVAPQESP